VATAAGAGPRSFNSSPKAVNGDAEATRDAPAHVVDTKLTVLSIPASTVPSACCTRVRIGISCHLAFLNHKKFEILCF
jgi:hypothetical protein